MRCVDIRANYTLVYLYYLSLWNLNWIGLIRCNIYDFGKSSRARTVYLEKHLSNNSSFDLLESLIGPPFYVTQHENLKIQKCSVT